MEKKCLPQKKNYESVERLKKKRTKVVDIVTRRTRLTFYPVSGMSHVSCLMPYHIEYRPPLR